MATPKMKVSHRRTHMRFAHWLGEKTAPNMTACSHCGEMIQNYCACPVCGYYRGRKVLKVAADKAETEAKAE
ncbi:50S ribosomal protein L32 [Pyramidobacter piscolens]|uniref:Large ribosomal subunit protein bL32 n=1 Tax=Pyramidobacter piscolens W5455 TaxID=352165 RepID=A0ABM9ZV82_9BACT|nr:50S ribosomal protein L32 [Pyramidobacter piscolens]EFB90805.1 ribosomal protein L32 [Pyramidobacter piscolens W5455]BDF79053.1 50S ribosomal protein L32 [Pyramidobacter piscolens]